MLKVGLTGGIGSGKSTAVKAFQKLGAGIIDADKIAREILDPESEGLMEVVKVFGNSILNDNNELDRQRLKTIIFAPSDDGKKALLQLESITHPRIRAEIQSQTEDFSSKLSHPYLIVDIPLLIEKDYQSLFDRIVVVDCSIDQQIERVKARDDIEIALIKKIISQQASRVRRKEAATDILDNSGSKQYLLNQVDSLHTYFVSLSQH